MKWLLGSCVVALLGCVDASVEVDDDANVNGSAWRGRSFSTAYGEKHAEEIAWCEQRLDHEIGVQELKGCLLARSAFRAELYVLLTVPAVAPHEAWRSKELAEALESKYDVTLTDQFNRVGPHGQVYSWGEKKAYQDVMLALLTEKWGTDFISRAVGEPRITDCRWPDPQPGDLRAEDRLSEKQIRETVTANYADIQGCHAEQMADDELRVDAKATIDETGKIVELDLRSVDAPELHACMKRALLEWQFPEGKVTETSIPFVFRASEPSELF